MDSLNSTLIQTASTCLGTVAIQVATVCGVTVSTAGSIAFATDFKTTMKCVCTDTQVATVTGALNTCLPGSTEATLAKAEITTICGKVNDASSKCSDTLNPFGNAMLAAVKAAGPTLDQMNPAQTAVCANKKDIQAFLTECTDLSPLLDLNSVCPAGSGSGSTTATPVTSTASTTTETGKLLTSSASAVSLAMLAILAVAALF
ncbi:hypothetical protein BJ741DRAFT_592589 [Chytriomyces cf. hyalinus JEL632]|nr:hypothetical protein BJ741DRAFT_592589 [Chytriomyces cf. hyalinus JEL632]